MDVLGHGIDLVDTQRIERMIAAHGDRFLERCFTAAERAYFARVSDRRRVEHVAGRFAAKEAVLKALGTGLAGGITWLDVEIERAATGAPGVHLAGRAAAVADTLGVCRWTLSISHVAGMAMASAIALGVQREA
ncbi:MAG: holo-ACP synthase [Phycisphaeraceae bacterium]